MSSDKQTINYQQLVEAERLIGIAVKLAELGTHLHNNHRYEEATRFFCDANIYGNSAVRLVETALPVDHKGIVTSSYPHSNSPTVEIIPDITVKHPPTPAILKQCK